MLQTLQTTGKSLGNVYHDVQSVWLTVAFRKCGLHCHLESVARIVT